GWAGRGLDRAHSEWIWRAPGPATRRPPGQTAASPPGSQHAPARRPPATDDNHTPGHASTRRTREPKAQHPYFSSVLERGRARVGKTMEGFEIVGPSFIVTGADEAQFEAGKETTRQQIAFYGSTPAYRGVLQLHGG